MPSLPTVSGIRVVQALERHGFKVARVRGSHQNVIPDRRWMDGGQSGGCALGASRLSLPFAWSSCTSMGTADACHAMRRAVLSWLPSVLPGEFPCGTSGQSLCRTCMEGPWAAMLVL